MEKKIVITEEKLKAFAKFIFMGGRSFGTEEKDKPFDGYVERRDATFNKVWNEWKVILPQ